MYWEQSVDSNISPRTWITSYGKIVFTFRSHSYFSHSHLIHYSVWSNHFFSLLLLFSYALSVSLYFPNAGSFNLDPCWMCALGACTHLMYQNAFATWMIRIMMTWCCRHFLIRSLSNGGSNNNECTQVKRALTFTYQARAHSWWKNANRLLLFHCLCCLCTSTYTRFFLRPHTFFSLFPSFSSCMEAQEHKAIAQPTRFRIISFTDSSPIFPSFHLTCKMLS